MDQLLQHHLYRAKHRMKKQADQSRTERSFNVGDMVFLKLQPYVQTSLAPRAHQKLAFRFFGPFRILERVDSMAYKLDLPAHSSIHPVFHVSWLKQAVGAGHDVTLILPSDFAIKLAPEQVLDTRVILRGADRIRQVFIKWNNLPSSLDTWEDYEPLRQEFSHVFQGGRDGSTVAHSATGTNEAEEAAEETDSGPRCSTMMKKANPRFDAKTWVRG
jgi:hypothetical protein